MKLPRAAVRASRGFALITVLWLVALLTLLAVSMATLSLNERRAVQRYVESVSHEYAADSAIRLTALKIFEGTPAAREAAMSGMVSVPGGQVLVTAVREAGRIDINAAPQALLVALFAGSGWQDRDAREMAACIADWRDADDSREDDGAERDDYLAAGLPYGPRNAPFESLDELHQVLGGARISGPLLDALTVYSHSELPSEEAASPIVHGALVWAEERQLDHKHWLAEPTQSSETTGGAPATPSTTRATTRIGEIIRVRACLQEREAIPCRVAVIRLTGSERRPLQVYSWQTE